MKNLENVNKSTTGQNRQRCEMAYLLDLSVNKFSMASAFHAGDRGSNPLGDAINPRDDSARGSFTLFIRQKSLSFMFEVLCDGVCLLGLQP